MYERQRLFKVEELPEQIFQFYQFGYFEPRRASQKSESTESSESLWKSSFERFRQDFERHILGRLGAIFESAKYVSIEFSYVETEWKDMIALHYINTTYAAKLLPRTIRVHFLTGDSCCSENYLGFITLRPIEELQIVLSYVFVNWNLLKDEAEGAMYKFVGYEKRVHCLGKEILIKTYPLLAQDTIVTCCADVNIITLSRFLAHKFGGKKLEIRDICGDDYNVVYPRQVTAQRFVELCSNMHIPFKTQEIYLHKLKACTQTNAVSSYTRTREDIMEYIDAYLDSDLPVVIFSCGHVIQLVGYRCINESKEYLVLDDSGFNDPQNQKRFCYFIDASKMFGIPFPTESGAAASDDDVTESTDDGVDFAVVENFINFLQNDVMTIGIPQSERVYIDFYYYKILLDNMVRQLWKESCEQYCWFFDREKNYLPRVKTRSRLVECTQLIQFLSENRRIAHKNKEGLQFGSEEKAAIDKIIDNLECAISTLDSLPLPHYLWYTELSNESGILVGLCADPTRFYKDTTHLDKVFYNCLFDDDKRGIAILKSMWE